MNISCDICGAPMKMTKQEGFYAASFDCTKCDQWWGIDHEGKRTCTVLGHLFPSEMKEDSDLYRKEYMPWWLQSKKYYAEMCLEVGIWDNQKHDEFIDKCQQTYDKWFLDHPIKWWEFWK